jgi:drug/metabolite transporter (DMT)-like permease
MSLPANLLGALFALSSACLWGSGDFGGGLAVRRSNPFQVLVLSCLSGIAVLLGCTAIWRETLPSLGSVLWAMAAGGAGVIGMAALYRALSLGHAASVAPTAAVTGAALPVCFSFITEGWPSALRLAGFALALLGIWLVSQASTPGGEKVTQRGWRLACLAGGSFGFFFILLAQIEPGAIFVPLVLSRCAALGLTLLLLFGSRTMLPPLTSNPTALLVGALDAGGNVFYVLAKHLTRLDVATVLGSLYPAATVLLARLVLKEDISRGQWAGVGLCLLAIVLITV